MMFSKYFQAIYIFTLQAASAKYKTHEYIPFVHTIYVSNRKIFDIKASKIAQNLQSTQNLHW